MICVYGGSHWLASADVVHDANNANYESSLICIVHCLLLTAFHYIHVDFSYVYVRCVRARVCASGTVQYQIIALVSNAEK